MPTRACKRCGAAFEVPYPSSSRVYCTPACHATAKAEIMAAGRASGTIKRKRHKWPACQVYFPTCRCCGQRFTARAASTIYCSGSRDCYNERQRQRWAAAHPPHPRACADCGETFYTTRSDRRYCSNRCLTRALRRVDNYRRKRAARIDRDPTIGRHDLGERDGWRCHICQRKVNPKARGQTGPSIDHLIPIADGGTDHPINLAIAHRRCNSRRQRGAAQLRLTG